jgi:hypothetical protein
MYQCETKTVSHDDIAQRLANEINDLAHGFALAVALQLIELKFPNLSQPGG